MTTTNKAIGKSGFVSSTSGQQGVGSWFKTAIAFPPRSELSEALTVQRACSLIVEKSAGMRLN